MYEIVLHLASSTEPFQRQNFNVRGDEDMSSDEKQTSSRFHGITIFQVCNETEYGVELPQFLVYNEVNNMGISSSNQPIISTLPKSQTADGGVPVFLRTDLEDEETAAKLYAFVVKLMYGQEAITQLHAKLQV